MVTINGPPPPPLHPFEQVEIEEAPVPTPAPTEAFGPYLGTVATIPGTIEAEAFDYGGEGVGYHDTTPGNSGGVSGGEYRAVPLASWDKGRDYRDAKPLQTTKGWADLLLTMGCTSNVS